MSVKTIAVVATGDMGHTVDGALIKHGFRVDTSLAGRSQHSCDLAAKASIEDLGSLEFVASEADLFLSILPTVAVFSLVKEMVAAMRAVGLAPV